MQSILEIREHIRTGSITNPYTTYQPLYSYDLIGYSNPNPQIQAYIPNNYNPNMQINPIFDINPIQPIDKDDIATQYFKMSKDKKVLLKVKTNALPVFITIPEGIEIIGKNAFRGCIFLSEICFPKSLKCIEDGAFLNCPALKTIKFNENSKLKYIGDYAFFGINMKNVLNIPKNIYILVNMLLLINILIYLEVE